jgi:putative flippase GtrA
MRGVFFRYVSVGLVNTVIHCGVFAVMFYALGASQAVSNLLGFAVAVTFSFFANARYTFNAHATTVRYLLYVAFMGLLAATFGLLADLLALPPVVTLVLFAAVSLVCGFIYARFVVFTKFPVRGK